MISIDTVHQRVLALANKEQRGYITPQEFNLYANQAQMDIFEEYFYDIDLHDRKPSNSTEYSNTVELIDEKLSLFKEKVAAQSMSAPGRFKVPTDIYRLGSVLYNEKYIIDEVQDSELIYFQSSPLTVAKKTRPVYTKFKNSAGVNAIQVYPTSINNLVTLNVIKQPKKVTWGYVVVNGNALYNAGTSENFELHPSEQSKLVYKILGLAGINIKDQSLYQIASAEEQKDINQQKS